MIAGSSPALQSSVLALNRHYVPVHILSAKRSLCLLYKGLAEVVAQEGQGFQSYDFDRWLETSMMLYELGETDDDDWIRGVTVMIRVPRVIRLLRYDHMPRHAVKFNRRNVFLRDEFVCQYCGRRFGGHRLSLDHVLPKSRGGPTTWENIVCCCVDCNTRKGGRTPREAGMNLIRQPHKPAHNPIIIHYLQTPKYESWKIFLSEAR